MSETNELRPRERAGFLVLVTMVVAAVLVAVGAAAVNGYALGLDDCLEASPAAAGELVPDVQTSPLVVFVAGGATADPSMGGLSVIEVVEAPGEEAFPEPTDAAGAASLIAQGIRLVREGGPATTIGVGLLLMGFVFFARMLLPGVVPKDWIATVTLGLTALAGFASAIAAGAPPLDSALTFLVLGAAAVGFWESAGKKLYKMWRGSDEDPRPALRGGS